MTIRKVFLVILFLLAIFSACTIMARAQVDVTGESNPVYIPAVQAFTAPWYEGFTCEHELFEDGSGIETCTKEVGYLHWLLCKATYDEYFVLVERNCVSIYG